MAKRLDLIQLCGAVDIERQQLNYNVNNLGMEAGCGRTGLAGACKKFEKHMSAAREDLSKMSPIVVEADARLSGVWSMLEKTMDAPVQNKDRFYVEGATFSKVFPGAVETELVKVKKVRDTNMVRLNVTLICTGSPKIFLRGVVKDTESNFRNALVQFNVVVMYDFGRALESAFLAPQAFLRQD